jgi:hypothetical protein
MAEPVRAAVQINSAPRGEARKIFGSRLYFVFSVYVFRAILDLCYVYYLSISFLDDPITPMPLNVDFGRLVISYLLIAPLAQIVPCDKKNLSGIFFLAALAFLYVPMTSMAGMNSEKSLSPVLIVGFAILVSRMWIALPSPALPMPSSRHGISAAVMISLTMVSVFVAWSIISGAARNFNLDINKIYIYRESLSEVLDIGRMAYFNLWVQKIFNPFLLAIGFFYKKRVLLIVCIFLQMYFFAITQHRSHIFVPVLIYFVYVLYHRNFYIATIYNLIGITLVFLLLVAVYLDLDQLLSIVIRRAFYVGGSVTFDWIAYFNDNPHVYFADNLLKKYVVNSYSGENLPALMSRLVFSGKEFGFNTGLVGAGYAQLGMAGVFLYATVIGLIVWLVNGLIERGLPAFVAVAILFEPMRTAWAESDVLTTLLSHGVLIGMLLMWVHGQTASRVKSSGIGTAYGALTKSH